MGADALVLHSPKTREKPYYGWANLAIAALAMVGTLPGRTQRLGLVTEPLSPICTWTASHTLR